MKKILSIVLVILMTASLMAIFATAATPTYKSYADAQDGDVLYEVDFGATDPAFAFMDGHAKGVWYKTGAVVSGDGKSVTFQHTTENLKYTDPTEAANQTKGRAKFWTQLTEYPVAGKSFTIEFTLESAAPVGIYLDCGAGFVINPAENTTSIGEYSNATRIAGKEVYAGTFEAKQSYAIELCVTDTLAANRSNYNTYFPTLYKLYVKDEATNSYRLVRELDLAKANWFEWEPNPGKPLSEGWECLYVNAVRFDDNYTRDDIGNPIKSTLSNMVIRKGVDLLEISEVVPPADTEPETPEDTGTTPEDTGATETEPKETQNVPNPDDFAPPKPVTNAPETDAQTEPAEGGCASSIAMAGIAVVTVTATGIAVVSSKKKED